MFRLKIIPGICITLLAINSFAKETLSRDSSTPVFACMSFQQQRESVESFLALIDIQAKFANAVIEDRRLEQTCFNLDLIKDESSVSTLLKIIGQDREGIKIASPQRDAMVSDAYLNNVAHGVLIYSISDLNLSYNIRDQKRNEVAFQLSQQQNQKEPREKNMFDNLGSTKRALTYGITYYGSTERVVRKVVGGGAINLSQKLSALIAKTLALMWGDVYFNEPIPQGFASSAREDFTYEVKTYNFYESLGLNQDFEAETKTKAVFFLRYEF